MDCISSYSLFNTTHSSPLVQFYSSFLVPNHMIALANQNFSVYTIDCRDFNAWALVRLFSGSFH